MDTAYGVNAPEAVKLWSFKLDREALKRTYIKRFMGNDTNSMIQIKNETNKGPGDRIRITLRKQLRGRGTLGDANQEGNEESLTTWTQDLIINQLRHAVRSEGKMTEQRIPFSIRNEGMNGLADWWAERWDIWGFYHLAGFTPGNVISSGDEDTDNAGPEYNGHNTITAPTRQVFAPDAAGVAQTTDQAVAGLPAAEGQFTLAMIDRAVERAKVTGTNIGHVPIRPIMVSGQPWFVVFIHPYQVTDLRTTTSATASKPVLWYDIQRSRIQGGEKDSNPIFSGALGEYNGCILHESTHVPEGVDSGTGAVVSAVRRAILCGAQAGVAGFGEGHDKQTYDWFEQMFDYGNKIGVKAGCISGLKKSTYVESGTPRDFATVVMSSKGQPH